MKISPAIRRRIFEAAAEMIDDYKEHFSCTAITHAIPRVLKLKWNNARCLDVERALLTEYAEFFKPEHIPFRWPWWVNSRYHEGDRKGRVLALLFMAELQ